MKSSISSKIRDYKNGNHTALEDILNQMAPLLKKYAGKTHFMEYEDAFQEYAITLIEATIKIKSYENEGQTLAYINTCVKNKFNSLFKAYCIAKEQEAALYDKLDHSEMVNDNFAEFLYLIDLKAFIKQIDSQKKREIATLAYLKGLDDTTISDHLHLSRQYVNRVRRELNKKLVEHF